MTISPTKAEKEVREACNVLATYHRDHPASMNVFRNNGEQDYFILVTSDPEIVKFLEILKP